TSGSYADRVSAVSFRDSPFSTEEPLAFIDSVSAESRLAASSKDDEMRVDDSKKTLTTSRPRRVGSFFVSRSSEPPQECAVARRRPTYARSRSPQDSRGRRPGSRGGRRSLGTTCSERSLMSLLPRARRSG